MGSMSGYQYWTGDTNTRSMEVPPEFRPGLDARNMTDSAGAWIFDDVGGLVPDILQYFFRCMTLT